MKTNESDTPWDPKPELDQKDDGKLYKAGLDQLDRDVLRFLELVPDIQMAKVTIATNVAFPLAPKPSDRALTKDDFLADNAKVLLEKLGVPEECLQPKVQGSCDPPSPTPEDEETYKRMICRYLGAHAQLPAKISMEKGLEALNLAVKGTEGGLRAEALASTLCDVETVENMRIAVARDARMKEIQSAVLKPKFGKGFQLQNANIQLKDLKHDRDRFLKQTSTKSYPLFGSSVIKAVLKAADVEAAHQGAQAIIDMLNKEKNVFFDENGIPLDQKTTVDEHVQGCTDCSEVQKIKDKVLLLALETSLQNPEEFELEVQRPTLLQIPEAVELEVLLYADKRHQGFAEAYNRVKSWVDFPDIKRKVHLKL